MNQVKRGWPYDYPDVMILLFGHRVMSHNGVNVKNELSFKVWLDNLWVSLSPEADAA